MATAPVTVNVGQERDRFVCGYPKTGRTWLRYMIANYLTGVYGIDVDITLANIYSVVPNDSNELIPGQQTFTFSRVMPKIIMSHASHEPRFDDSRLIFLTRDPRDVMVSHWLHHKHQRATFNGSVSEFITNLGLGINAFCEHLDSWSPHLNTEQVVSYETMRDKTEEKFGHVLDVLGINVDTSRISSVVLASSFERMRRVEMAHGIAGHDYDRLDPEALRVRRGEVGGYQEYLSDGDIQFIDHRVSACTAASKAILELTAYIPSSS